MSKASDEFEILVSRIHRLLEEDDADVEWNERIPDPDNPVQGRQIDVVIRNGELLILVECRLRQNPQNVTWIEELIGRRTSLNANAVVAVSASGFTSGAIKKAAKYGVTVRDLTKLTENEIRAWTRSIEISVFYYRYQQFNLCLFFDQCDEQKLDFEKLQKEIQEYVGFQSLFTSQLDILDNEKLMVEENRTKRVEFKTVFALDGFQLCDCDVKQVEATGIAVLEEIKLNVPELLAYGEPGLETENRTVFVQNYNLGETKVIHHEDRVSLTLDLAELDVPPYWQFRFMEVSSEHEHYMDLLELVHPENIVMRVDKLDLSIRLV